MSNLIIPNLGFVNTGAICYFNSLIQSLLSCDSFLEYICKEKQDSVFYLFFKLITIEKQWDPYFTSKLLHLMGGFEPNQSSSEYFLKLCDYLKMDDLFKTNTEITTICQNCKKESSRIDTSVYFVIDHDLKEFCETIRDVEDFNCDGCNQKVNVKIISRIKEISPILVFSFNKYFDKKNIPYPKGFFIDENKEYHLISTIEHHGVLQGGHYFCRALRNQSILKIDDNHVSNIENIDPTDQTYMVFYQRVK